MCVNVYLSYFIIFHNIFRGEIFVKNLCLCKVCANFHVWVTYIYLGSLGFNWVNLGVLRFTWVNLCSLGFTKVHLGSLRPTRVDSC